MVCEIYTQQGLSINAIARLLNEREIPTRTGRSRWERSTVWAILRNPAYRGAACYGKTELRPRQRITRPLRRVFGRPMEEKPSIGRNFAPDAQLPVPSRLTSLVDPLAEPALHLVNSKTVRSPASLDVALYPARLILA